MPDLLYLGLTIVLFVATQGLIAACERLREAQP